MDADQIIQEPVLTEKTNAMRQGEVKKYTFKVHPKANKIQIMSAIRELFSVKPVSCNVINVKKKPKMSRTQKRSGPRYGSTTPWKKAMVTLRKGETIDIIEGT